MKFNKPSKYHLRLANGGGYSVQKPGSDRTTFHKPETLVCPKIYVVLKRPAIHYVGITNRPMSARLGYGLRATGKGGYHGYQWKGLRGKLDLLVWSFPEKSGKSFMRYIETIEAEFAYLVRNTTGTWPRSQTEIHFYHPTRAHVRAAADILSCCAE